MKLHIVADNYATHKHPAVQSWLVRNRRITMHFTPTSGSWLNMVEIFFGITRQAIRRGKARWAIRWKPALNAFAITFAGRIVPSSTN